MLNRKFLSLIVFLALFVFYFNTSGSSVEDMSANKKDIGQVLGVFEKNDNQIASASLPVNERISKPSRNKGSSDFLLQAGSGFAMDYDTGETLFNKKENEQMAIASITKLATALVINSLNPDWDAYYKVEPTDRCEGGVNLIATGEELKIKDLLYLMLMASENNAAIALMHAVGMEEEDFVNLMNDQAKDWGLEKTIFMDPVGIDNGNISTARDIALLTKKALDNPYIREATLTKELKVTTKNGKIKTVKNTDKLLEAYPSGNIDIRGGKTGHTNKAGYCFTGRFTNENNKEIVTVVLDDRGPDSRFRSTKEMVNWVYNNFSWN